MKKIFSIVLSLAVLVSCDLIPYENPSFPGYPERYKPVSLTPNCTIAELVSTYSHGSPKEMMNGKIIGGRVSTTDQPGNFYKSLYIQDETGGIELKIGKNGLYNDYLEGQMLYVVCDGLYIGEYGYKASSSGGNGMVQIGYDGTGTDYETSYMENSLLIDTHIMRDDPTDLKPVTPVVITESQLPGTSDTQRTCPYLGKLVTIKNLSYGWYDSRYKEDNTAFTLLYLNSKKDKKASSNRIFITGEETGVSTWAMSKTKMTEYLLSGIWDDFSIGNAGDYNYGKVGDDIYKYPYDEKTKTFDYSKATYPAIEKNAYSTSQYFSTASGKCVQVRTSGYGKFGDVEIPAAVLAGTQTINVTGILTLYQGKVQITVNRLSDITFN